MSMPPEASTENAPLPPAKPQTGDFDPTRLLEAIPLVGLLASIAASVFYGFPTGLIVIGATLLLAGIWNLWVSLQLVAGDRPGLPEATAPESDTEVPSYEEEQKAFLLRALDDLEFERSVGKIDDDDYRVLREQYRERARQALAAEDAGDPRRQEAESIVRTYLEEQGLTGPSTTSASPAPEDEKTSDADEGRGKS
jgi:hypothetical protein